MSTTLEVGDILTIRHEFTDVTSVAFNLLEYQCYEVTVTATGLPAATAIPLSPIAQDIASVAYNSYKDPWALLACENCQMTGTTIQSVHPSPRSRPFTYTPLDAQEGTRAGQLLPLQDTVTFLKRSGYGERWGMGRIFFVGLSESDQEAGFMIPAWVTLAQAEASGFTADLLVVTPEHTIQFKPVLWRGVGAPLPNPVPVTGCELSNNIIKTQRRRRPGKGI